MILPWNGAASQNRTAEVELQIPPRPQEQAAVAGHGVAPWSSGYEPDEFSFPLCRAHARNRTAFPDVRSRCVTIYASRARIRPPPPPERRHSQLALRASYSGGETSSNGRPSWHGPSPHYQLSTTRESNPALSLGRRGPNRSVSGARSACRELNPVLLAGSEACSHEHFRRVSRSPLRTCRNRSGRLGRMV